MTSDQKTVFEAMVGRVSSDDLSDDLSDGLAEDL